MDRVNIKNKYNGKCAYCGYQLDDHFHIDRINPGMKGGKYEIENCNPACPSCNIWKRTYSIDQFRIEIELQRERLMKIPGVRLAIRYGLLNWTDQPVIFEFEKRNK